jgi:hypothetical protein
MKANEYRRGYHDGLREAIAWLHARAREMNDPHAKRILNTAAFHLGVEVADERRKFPIAEASVDADTSGQCTPGGPVEPPAHR